MFQIFWGNGNQSFLSTTFAPDRREILRFVKKLRFLLSPRPSGPSGLQVARALYDTLYTRVFQICLGRGNQRFSSTTFAPDRRETLRFAKTLRFFVVPRPSKVARSVQYLTIYIIGDVKNTSDTLSRFYAEVVRHRPKHVF